MDIAKIGLMDFLDFLFPKKCVVCKKYGDFLCQNCIREFEELVDICPVCQKPSSFGETHFFCRSRYSLDGLISGFGYNHVVKTAIHRFKYQPYIAGLACLFGELLAQLIEKREKFRSFLKGKVVFVPIPLHWWRKHLRGYNQAFVLAYDLGRRLGIGVEDILVRTKLTKPQSELLAEERRRNVEGVFEVKGEKIPTEIVLIDDVWTTGATMKSAARALKKRGAQKIWALTLAR